MSDDVRRYPRYPAGSFSILAEKIYFRCLPVPVDRAAPIDISEGGLGILVDQDEEMEIETGDRMRVAIYADDGVQGDPMIRASGVVTSRINVGPFFRVGIRFAKPDPEIVKKCCEEEIV